MTAKTTKKRNKRFKRGEKRCFTPRYLTYKDFPKREIQEPQVLGRSHRGQRPQSSPSGERKTLPRQEYSHACPVFIRTPPRGKSKNLRFLAGVIGDSVPNRPHPAKKKHCMPRQEYSHACPAFIRTPQRGKSKNLRFLAGVIGDSVPYRPSLHPSAESERKPA